MRPCERSEPLSKRSLEMNSANHLRRIQASPGRRRFHFDAVNRFDGTERMILPTTASPVKRNRSQLSRDRQRRPTFDGSHTWRRRARKPFNRFTDAFQRTTTSGNMRRPSMRKLLRSRSISRISRSVALKSE